MLDLRWTAKQRGRKLAMAAFAIAMVLSVVAMGRSGVGLGLFIGPVCGGLAYYYGAKLVEADVLSACLAFARTVVPGFQNTRYVIGAEGQSGLLLDEQGGHVFVFESGGATADVVPLRNLSGCELVEDGSPVMTTKRGLGSAALGGLAFGGLGLVAGAVVGEKNVRQRTEVSEVLLKIETDSKRKPFYRVTLFSSRKPTDIRAPAVKAVLRAAEDCSAILSAIIQESRATSAQST